MFARLLLLFIVVPAVELVLLIKIGGRIGLLPTLGLILVTGFLGAFLTKLQGVRALDNFRRAFAEGRLPREEVLDGVMILLAGAVLLTPGFLTDAAGFALLIPSIRRPIGRRLAGWIKANVKVVTYSQTSWSRTRVDDNDDAIDAEAEEVIDERKLR